MIESPVYKIKEGIIKKTDGAFIQCNFFDGAKLVIPLGPFIKHYHRGDDVKLFSIMDDNIPDITHMLMITSKIFSLAMLCIDQENGDFDIFSAREYPINIH